MEDICIEIKHCNICKKDLSIDKFKLLKNGTRLKGCINCNNKCNRICKEEDCKLRASFKQRTDELKSWLDHYTKNIPDNYCSFIQLFYNNYKKGNVNIINV